MYLNLLLLRKNYSRQTENFKADFLKMASATHATFQNTSHPHFLEQKCDLSTKITSRTCRFETCRYFKLPNFKLRLILWKRVTYMVSNFQHIFHINHVAWIIGIVRFICHAIVSCGICCGRIRCVWGFFSLGTCTSSNKWSSSHILHFLCLLICICRVNSSTSENATLIAWYSTTTYAAVIFSHALKDKSKVRGDFWHDFR